MVILTVGGDHSFESYIDSWSIHFQLDICGFMSRILSFIKEQQILTKTLGISLNDWLRYVDRKRIFYKSSFIMEKAVASHSSTLAWKIPWPEKPGGLQSMGSLTVRHDWVTSLSLFTFMHWGKKWQPTPVFLPGESQGQGEPDGLPSMGSHRVGHDWSDLAAAADQGNSAQMRESVIPGDE